jgi:hypothetical protein
MGHLKEIGMTYFQHMLHAFKIAFILVVHGVFPNVWKTKASELINK